MLLKNEEEIVNLVRANVDDIDLSSLDVNRKPYLKRYMDKLNYKIEKSGSFKLVERFSASLLIYSFLVGIENET